MCSPEKKGFSSCLTVPTVERGNYRKENPNTSNIKVLAVSVFDTKENREEILKSGAGGFMAKPLDNVVFLNNVNRLCQK